jgi:UDP-N-acetylglucosamine diphosphorylase/glucosamine-1-phosphate N-acetyltransferase
MNYILFDSFHREALLPFAYTRPVADIRVGILTIREKWEKLLGVKTSTLTEDYLSVKYPLVKKDNNVLINGSVLPTAKLVQEVKALKQGETLSKDDQVIAMYLDPEDIDMTGDSDSVEDIVSEQDFLQIRNTWDIFYHNGRTIVSDFELLTKGRKSQPVSKTNFVIGDPKLIFIEEGAVVEFAFLNTKQGPIYIGNDAEVMEGAKIKGPFALCEHAVVKMDAKIYAGTTIGPHSKAGGELNNVVILGYSNKGHDGFMGHSVIGEWCNIGADTNTSNLKNTYDNVRLWSYPEESFVNTGLQFCGLMLGDHSKCGINTMFNTGTVVGVSANIFGSGYQRNFIPSYSWGGTQGFQTFKLSRAFQVAEAMMTRRNIEFDQIEKDILTHIFEETSSKRHR